MLCSICKKNTAIVFINKVEDGKSSMEGYCYNCAKEKGINPLQVLNEQNEVLSKDNINIADMTNQLEDIFKDLSENLNLEALGLDNLENLTGDFSEENEDGMPRAAGFAIPLGALFSKNKKEENGDQSSSKKSNVKVDTKKKEKNSKKKKYLDTYGTNLTVKAKNNQLDMVIGRDKEIQRIVQILNRRSKNNPCLIGEPGVGKTAIAQGLAIKIANQNVPAKLLNKEVYLLDMTAVIAGTQFRGQFEARMKGIIDECTQYGNIILVIDEIHNIIGAGDAEHSMNAADILKPSLSNGEIQLIGTTTLKEYRKYIEKDTARKKISTCFS